MTDQYNALIAGIGVFIVLIILIVIAIYVAEAIFLNKLNKKIYGQGTALAWIPIANIYLLGKLAFNKAVGFALLAIVLVFGAINNSALSSISTVLEIIALVIAIMKYSKLKNGVLSAEQAKVECDSTSFTDLPFLKNSSGQSANNPQPTNVSQPETQQNPQPEASSFCTNCGAKVDAGTEFCPSCGQKIN